MKTHRVLHLGALLFLGIAVPTASRTPAQQQRTAPRPAAEHRTLLACDLVESVAATCPGISIHRSTGVFTHEALEHSVPGCHLVIGGSFASSPPGEDAVSRLREGFAAQGWQEMSAYSSDGEDGTAFALRKKGVACLFRGTWTGGADGEPSVRREQAYSVSVLCTSPVPPDARGHRSWMPVAHKALQQPGSRRASATAVASEHRFRVVAERRRRARSVAQRERDRAYDAG